MNFTGHLSSNKKKKKRIQIEADAGIILERAGKQRGVSTKRMLTETA